LREEVSGLKGELLRIVRVEAFVGQLRGEVERIAEMGGEGLIEPPTPEIRRAETELDAASKRVEDNLDHALQCLRRWARLWREHVGRTS
jgi:hypothetical protein